MLTYLADWRHPALPIREYFEDANLGHEFMKVVGEQSALIGISVPHILVSACGLLLTRMRGFLKRT